MYVVLAIAVLAGTIGLFRALRTPTRTLPVGELRSGDDRTDCEEQFAYGVLERILARTLDANRYVDMLLLGLIAAQTALLVLLLERESSFRGHVIAGLLIAAALASFAILLSALVREAPEPAFFLVDVTTDARRAVRENTRRFVRFAEHNDRVRIMKTIIFVIALLILLSSTVAATIGTMVESRKAHEHLQTRSSARGISTVWRPEPPRTIDP